MSSDEELEKLVEELLKKLLGGESRVEAEPGSEFKTIDSTSPHGVYVYDKSRRMWVLAKTKGGAFKPERDGLYAVYFSNTRCPACKTYDTVWYPYIDLVGWKLEDTEFVVVLCAWFAYGCSSEAASKSFRDYNVKASPTTLFLCMRGGEKVFEERIEGARNMEFLASKIEELRRKCRDSASQPTPWLPSSQGM